MSEPSEAWADDGNLALSLSARMARALPLRQFAAWPAGFESQGQNCNANADRWVLLHPAWRALRGWVLLCNAPFEGAQYAAAAATGAAADALDKGHIEVEVPEDSWAAYFIEQSTVLNWVDPEAPPAPQN